MHGNSIAHYNKKLKHMYQFYIFTHRMEYISEYDYAEVKTFTMKELETYLVSCKQNREVFLQIIESLEGEEKEQALETIKEYDSWIVAYSNEIMIRLSIKTPPLKPSCYGCEQGCLNQMGHYGGCIPDPLITDEYSLEE